MSRQHTGSTRIAGSRRGQSRYFGGYDRYGWEEYPVCCRCHSVVTGPFEMRGGIDKLVLDLYRRPDFARRLIDRVFNYQLGPLEG
ncbi:MAG: hypothetical protein ACUVTM_02705 [Candidatus Bathyarchaeia archaeon]